MAESDWDTVTVLRKKGPTAAQAKSKQAILAAQRRGEDVETSKKYQLTCGTAAHPALCPCLARSRGRWPEQAALGHQEHGEAGPGDRGAAPRPRAAGGRQGDPAGPAGPGADAEGPGHENQREAASHCGLREWPGHSQQPGSGQDRESHWPEAPGEGHWEADREGAKGEMNIKPRNQCVPADLVRLVPLTTGASTALSMRLSGTRAGSPPGNPSPRTCCLTNKQNLAKCLLLIFSSLPPALSGVGTLPPSPPGPSLLRGWLPGAGGGGRSRLGEELCVQPGS